MNYRRAVLRTAVGVALLALLGATPVAAQASINEQLISNLNEKLLYVAIPIAVLVEAILFYTVYKYKDNDNPQPTQENRRLEITWTVATAIILLFVGFAAYQVLGNAAIGGVNAATVEDTEGAQERAEVTHYDGKGAAMPADAPEDAVQVEVVAQKYYWTYNYPTDSGEMMTTTDALVIPADRPVYLHITSVDWLHAVHVPKMGLKQDAFPGHYNTIKTVAYLNGAEEKNYQLYCAEYCGTGHSGMLSTVRVLPSEEYEQWKQDQLSDDSSSDVADPSEDLQAVSGAPA